MKQWRCVVVMAVLAMAHAGNAMAQEGASSGNTQLQRLLVDYHIAQIVQLGIQQSIQQGMVQSPPSSEQRAMLLRVVQQLDVTPDATFAKILTPSLRDCISEDRAREVADFLETKTGRAMVASSIQHYQHPGQVISPPPIDPMDRNLAQSFATNGGLAAFKQFSVCVNDPTRGQQMTIALVRYAKQQLGDAN